MKVSPTHTLACGWGFNNGPSHSGHTHVQLWLTITVSSPAPMKLEIIEAVSGDKSLSVCSGFSKERPKRRRNIFLMVLKDRPLHLQNGDPAEADLKCGPRLTLLKCYIDL